MTLEAARMNSKTQEGSSQWYAHHSARLLARANDTKNAILRADMQKTAARLRALGEQAGAIERKQARNLVAISE